MRLMRGDPQHDEIGVCSVQAMVGVGVVVGRVSLTTNEVHDLVLPLAWHVGI